MANTSKTPSKKGVFGAAQDARPATRGARSTRDTAGNEEAEFVNRGLMRVKAVKELTGMSMPEIYRCCHNGTFRYRRMPGGRGMLIYRASVEAFIREGLRDE